MDAVSPLQEVLAKRIAGEIILSGDPGRTLRKWRELLAVTQTRLARKLAVSPSVVSDYENGRRMPGTHFIRRFVAALFAIDGEAGGHLLREFARLTILPSDALLDVREFPIAVAGRQIVEAVEGVPVACEALLARRIYGYTVLDSLQFIQTLSSSDASAVFGTTTGPIAWMRWPSAWRRWSRFRSSFPGWGPWTGSSSPYTSCITPWSRDRRPGDDVAWGRER
jgi:putative transcriptional regulator